MTAETVTLKEYFEKLRAADQEAVKVLAANFEKRMDTTNEWRGALEDQAKGKAPIAEMQTLKERIEKLEVALAAMANKGVGIGMLAGVIVAIIASSAALTGIIIFLSGGGNT